jgi:hypothetical protein
MRLKKDDYDEPRTTSRSLPVPGPRASMMTAVRCNKTSENMQRNIITQAVGLGRRIADKLEAVRGTHRHAD